MKHNLPFQPSDINAPCDASWDEMRGDDTIRFCTHCKLSVYDVKRMTSKELRRLVAQSEGRLCVHFAKRPSEPAPPSSPPLYHIKRYAGRVAVGALGTALGLSTVWTYQQKTSSSSSFAMARLPSSGQSDALPAAPLATLQGQALGVSWGDDFKTENAKSIFQARVILTEQRTRTVYTVKTDDEGRFVLRNLPAGEYRLTVEAENFSSFTQHDITLQSGVTAWQTAHLEEYRALDGGVSLRFGEEWLNTVGRGDEAEIRAQLLAGADVNQKDKRSETTALHIAAAQHKSNIVRLLLAHGAKPDAHDYGGQTPLMAAAWQLLTSERYYVEKGREFPQDQVPAAVETVRVLINAGAGVNLADDDGDTALMLAAEMGDAAIIRVLLAAGADINIQNDKGETALSLARQAGKTPNIKALQEVIP